MAEKKMAPRVAARKAISTEIATSSLVAPDDSPNVMHDARARERAALNVRKYIAWKSINAHAYKMLISQATKRAEAGGVVSGDWLIGWLRSHDVVNDLGKPCSPNNDFSPLIVRDICRDRPQVGPHVETRTSVYDEFFKEGGEA